MKFIGQYIQSLIARFRADVYLESVGTSSETGVLVVDSDGKITKNTSISGGVAGTVTLADESTDTTCFPTFATADTGDQALKTGSNLSFNSNTGALTATSFVGPLTGQADTVATIAGLAPNTATTAAAQPNITSLGTLTSLDVDDVNINGGIITITGSTDDTFAIRTTTDGETIFSTTDTAGAEAHMNFNPDGEFRVTSDDAMFKSATSAHPTVKIENNTADATSGELVFYNERHGGNGANFDGLGGIHFKGPNSDRSDAEFTYASIVSRIGTSTDTDESGIFGVEVATSDGSTSNLRPAISILGHSSNNNFLIGLGFSTTCTVVASGKLSAPRREFSKTSNTDGTHDGDVVYFGSTTGMTTGRIYYYDSTDEWYLTNPDSVGKSTGLLGVALGSDSDTDGVLLRGMVTLNHDPGAVGDVLYLADIGGALANTGMASSTAPSDNGDIIRIVGYCLDASNGQIWFNPDNTFVEYTA